MNLPVVPSAMIELLRAWFFAKDRSVVLADNTFIEGDEISTPGNPVSGRRRLYAKTNGWCDLDSNGIETSLCVNPAARVYNSANISIPTGAGLTYLTFNSERFDNDSIHSTSSNTGRLTANTAGIYLISASIQIESNATGYRTLAIRLNGATFIAANTINAVNGAVTQMTIQAIYELAITNYVEIGVVQTSAGALNVTANGNYSPEFAMIKLSN